MRGGLDDALDKLARRDELRRRAAGEATGTPPAVQELVETIAGVVGRNPELALTVGVEGAGDPTLLHFFVEDGTVQVTVDPSVAARVAEAAAPKHADIDLDLDDAVDSPPATPTFAGPSEPGYAETGHAEPGYTEAEYAEPGYSETGYAETGGHADSGEQTRRLSYDDRDRYDPGTGYGTTPYGEPDPYSRPQNGSDSRESAFPTADTTGDNPYLSPFAATPPPPVPPQTAHRIRPEQYRAPAEPSAAERREAAAAQAAAAQAAAAQAAAAKAAAARAAAAQAAADQHGMPQPLPEPVPLTVDSEETDKAARRLAALLRDNPSLLRPAGSE